MPRSPRPGPPLTAPPPPPQLEATNRADAPPPGVNTPAAPPRIQEEEPKLAFETPGQSNTGSRTQTLARILPPSHTIQDALHGAARSANQGGADIGEMEVQIAPPQIPGLGSMQTPQKLKSTIAPQILSDTHGVDFRPYLIRVLTAVRRNWAAVVPESARLGRQGVTTLQFAIARDGSVPRLVISIPSGTEALDRAAVAGVSASNPFPPLPAEYPGADLRLQLVFTYNMPKQ
jgi:TonB family protein